MQILQKVKTAALASVAAAALAGCNGTGISGDDIAIAPESLDGVTINFFDLFTLDFDSDFSGEGNEGGNVDYTRNQESAFLGVENDDGATGRETYIPATSSLSGLNYTWVRTARDAGTLTITFRNNEVYPSPDETLFADMFWGGPERAVFRQRRRAGGGLPVHGSGGKHRA